MSDKQKNLTVDELLECLEHGFDVEAARLEGQFEMLERLERVVARVTGRSQNNGDLRRLLGHRSQSLLVMLQQGSGSASPVDTESTEDEAEHLAINPASPDGSDHDNSDKVDPDSEYFDTPIGDAVIIQEENNTEGGRPEDELPSDEETTTQLEEETDSADGADVSSSRHKLSGPDTDLYGEIVDAVPGLRDVLPDGFTVEQAAEALADRLPGNNRTVPGEVAYVLNCFAVDWLDHRENSGSNSSTFNRLYYWRIPSGDSGSTNGPSRKDQGPTSEVDLDGLREQKYVHANTPAQLGEFWLVMANAKAPLTQEEIAKQLAERGVDAKWINQNLPPNLKRMTNCGKLHQTQGDRYIMQARKGQFS